MQNQFYEKLFKIGNLKIGFDTLIFNEGTAGECPSKALGMCEFSNDYKTPRKVNKICYACKMEWATNVVAYRKRQEKYFLTNTAEQITKDIKSIIKKFKSRGLTIKYLRINEAHDLKSMNSVNKWTAIARGLKGITVYTYTHRVDLMAQMAKLDLPKNFIIQTSNFKVPGFNSFLTYFMDSELPKKALNCKGNCSLCKLCKTNHGKSIYVKEH